MKIHNGYAVTKPLPAAKGQYAGKNPRKTEKKAFLWMKLIENTAAM